MDGFFFKFYIHLSNYIGGVIGSPCDGEFDLRWGQIKDYEIRVCYCCLTPSEQFQLCHGDNMLFLMK
jgi:hypothetical protein